MAVHMEGPRAALRPFVKRRTRRIGMQRFGSTSAKMPECTAAAIASAAMGSPWSGKYACGILGGSWRNGNFKPLRIGLGGFQQYM